jgi:carbon storage regulator
VLTLTRSVGERIMIGDDIVIEVRAILDSHQVRIAIQAPRQVPVHRAELLEAISQENRDAASANGDETTLGALGQAVAEASPPNDEPA